MRLGRQSLGRCLFILPSIKKRTLFVENSFLANGTFCGTESTIFVLFAMEQEGHAATRDTAKICRQNVKIHHTAVCIIED